MCGQRASCHQRRAAHLVRRRRGGRASRSSRAWAACWCRSVMRWVARAWLSPHAGWSCCFPFLCLDAGADCRSMGADGQVELELGAEAPGLPADAEGTSIQHPPPSQHQRVGAARLRDDRKAQLDQRWGAAGGERRHDPPDSGGQDLQAFAVERPPPAPQDVNDVGATKHRVEVGVVGLQAGWVQLHGQDRQAGWLLEANDPNRWEFIEVDDPQAVPPPGDGPEPEFAPRESDTAVRWVDGPGANWTWIRSVGCGHMARRVRACDEPAQPLLQLGSISWHENPPRRVLTRTGSAMGCSWQMRPGP